ncbi:Subtilisin-like protease SBT4.2 [Vitis vinifera]|uniref:Subtilisin-like protease SBT4.2 n=1 Tax=Vitis vinifera TaxID=29760 RepID=A0A438ILD2_VITVI|nr:Subtilisin-like protease SBT4.2 [Vitis vinifera]
MQGEKQGERKNRVKKTEDKQLQSSCALLEHFPKSIFYILYTISKIRKSRIQCFKRLFVQCYGIPPEATRYMPQAGTLRTSRWKPISQPCEFNLLLRKYFAALLSVCEISQTPFFTCEMFLELPDIFAPTLLDIFLQIFVYKFPFFSFQPNFEDFSSEDERLSFLSLGGRISTFTRTVTNVGSPVSTYKAIVVGPPELSIQVEPGVLSFKSLGETQTFTVTVGVAALSNPVISGSLVWDDGVYKARSP